MEPKQEIASLDVAAVVAELSEREGSVFDKFYQYTDDLLRFKMRDWSQGRFDVVVEAGERKRLHEVEEPDDAPQRPPELAKLLRNKLSGGELVDVSQRGFDRVVTFEGERGDGSFSVVVELFGDGNLALVDDEGVVLRSLRTLRLRSRTVAPGEAYVYPEERLDPRELGRAGFEDVLRESDADVVRTLAVELNLGGTYAEEVCLRADVERETDVERLDDADVDAAYEALTSLLDEALDPDVESAVVFDGDRAVDVTPTSLEVHRDMESTAYPRYNEALDSYFERLQETEDDGDESRLDELRRVAEHQERAIEDKRREEHEIREAAERLYERYGEVEDLLEVVREARDAGYDREEIDERLSSAGERGVASAELYSGLRDGDVVVELDVDGGREVALDVDDGVESNASRLYEEAKDVAESREGAVEALEDTRREIERLKSRDAGGMEEKGGSDTAVRPRDDAWYHRFRWFWTTDGFLVIGGRNADQNEELYSKYMDPDDLFLHTQAHGGPITLVKASLPSETSEDVEFPEPTVEQAATFAASYSSVWKAGHGAADVYAASPDQVSKTPESGEYVEKGSVVVRGERDYYTVALDVSVGLRLDGQAGVVAGPTEAIERQTSTRYALEPGRYAPEDVAQRLYRRFREEHGDVVRRVTDVEDIRLFLPPGGSRIVDG
ncbi:MAG: ribosome rescue protein RqcH [Halobacteriota archaeon]